MLVIRSFIQLWWVLPNDSLFPRNDNGFMLVLTDSPLTMDIIAKFPLQLINLRMFVKILHFDYFSSSLEITSSKTYSGYVQNLFIVLTLDLAIPGIRYVSSTTIDQCLILLSLLFSGYQFRCLFHFLVLSWPLGVAVSFLFPVPMYNILSCYAVKVNTSSNILHSVIVVLHRSYTCVLCCCVLLCDLDCEIFLF